jgi:hypothetical protein
MKSFFTITFSILFYTYSSFGQCYYKAGESIPDGTFLVKSSGIKSLDSIVYSEINKLENFFQVKVDFSFFNGQTSDNAFYLRDKYSHSHTIVLGTNLLINNFLSSHNQGLEMIKAVLAHEFGHVVQNEIRWDEEGKRRELHSDFLAGYYLGKNYNHSNEQINILIAEFFKLGDNNFWSPNHHGTSGERQCSFLEGYSFAKESNTTIQSANNYAYKYVAADNPCGLRIYKQYASDVATNNVGALKIYSTDQTNYLVMIKQPNGYVYEYTVNSQRKKAALIENITTQYKCEIKIFKKSLISGTYEIGSLWMQAGKGYTNELVLHNNTFYNQPIDIQYYKELHEKRSSYNWSIYTGINVQYDKAPFTFSVERKLPFWGLSLRGMYSFKKKGDVNQTTNLQSLNYNGYGLDLKKSIYIPYIKSAFIGPTLIYSNLKTNDTLNLLSYPNQQYNFYYGVRFGGKRFIHKHFCYSWDFSFGQLLMNSRVKNPNFDINFMIGYMF